MYNDKVEGKEFRFEIRGDAVDEGFLSIDEKTGEVFVIKPVDREKHPFFHVSGYIRIPLECKDSNECSQKAEKCLTLIF